MWSHSIENWMFQGHLFSTDWPVALYLISKYWHTDQCQEEFHITEWGSHSVVGYPHKYCATIIPGHHADTSPFVDWKVYSWIDVSLFFFPGAERLPPRSTDFSKQWWRLCLGTTFTSFMFDELCSYSLKKQIFTIILWEATNSLAMAWVIWGLLNLN